MYKFALLQTHIIIHSYQHPFTEIPEPFLHEEDHDDVDDEIEAATQVPDDDDESQDDVDAHHDDERLGVQGGKCLAKNKSKRQAAQASTSTATQDSPEAESDSSGHGKRVYEKWTQEEQKLLVNLWAEDFDRIESKDSRKVWDEIADKINKNCKAKRSKRSTDKFQKKMKYLLDRYKKAKDWNSKQTGGNRKKSIFYDEIDEVLGCREIVALKHVEEAGSSASNTCTAESSSTSYSDEEDIQDRKVKRTERKKNRKRAIEEEAEEEERKLMKSAVSGLEAQRSDMNSFVQNFNRIQTDQLNTMNTLVGALTKFLEKQ
ncbi:hypothetical protein QZH41_006385 [Actinostola sp. cb2023]|nr:hypothetical protein QZH41_006385 [Actinostola sp. cb2023]